MPARCPHERMDHAFPWAIPLPVSCLLVLSSSTAGGAYLPWTAQPSGKSRQGSAFPKLLETLLAVSNASSAAPSSSLVVVVVVVVVLVKMVTSAPLKAAAVAMTVATQPDPVGS